MRDTTLVMMLAVTTVLGCDSAGDQDTRAGSDVRIGSEVSCPSCSIVIDSVVTLEHVHFTGPSTAIAWDSMGVFYVVDRTDGLLKAFDSDGRFVRSIGRRGGGPGEYEGPRNILVASDGSIVVVDGVLQRRTVFGRDGEVISSTRVPILPAFSNPAVLRPDGQLVLNSVVSAVGAPAKGHTIQLIDAEGNVTRSVDEAQLDPNASWRQLRLLWVRQNGDLLVARPFSLTIDVYTADLTSKGTITRVADWLPLQEPKEMPSDGVFDEPFAPRVVAIWEDRHGLLWLQFMVPSPSWKPMRRPSKLGREDYSNLASRPRIENIIEVLDVERQHVVARSRFDGPIGYPFGRGLYATAAEDSSGEPGLRISRPELRR